MSLSTLHTNDDENESDDDKEQTPGIHVNLLPVMNLVQKEQAQCEKT